MAITIGPVRISYPNLFNARTSEKYPAQGARFGCDLLIPKTDTQTIDMIMREVLKAKEDGVSRLWGGKEPKNLKMPLKDGDERDDENYRGHYILSPWSDENNPPNVVDTRVKPILDQSEIYGGVWANVSVRFNAYDMGGVGVNCKFAAGVQKVKDDEPFGGGRVSVNEAFGVIDSPTSDTQTAGQAINPLTGQLY